MITEKKACRMINRKKMRKKCFFFIHKKKFKTRFIHEKRELLTSEAKSCHKKEGIRKKDKSVEKLKKKKKNREKVTLIK